MKSVQHDATSWTVYQHEVFDLLVAALQWIAAEPDDALRYFEVRDVAAGSIGNQWRDAYRARFWPVGAASPRSAFDPPLSFEATLHDIEQMLDDMSDQDWTEDGFRIGTAWMGARSEARRSWPSW